jgi:hypothetical protein
VVEPPPPPPEVVDVLEVELCPQLVEQLPSGWQLNPDGQSASLPQPVPFTQELLAHFCE